LGQVEHSCLQEDKNIFDCQECTTKLLMKEVRDTITPIFMINS